MNKIDNVNSPNHYRLDGLGIEVIHIIENILGTEGFKAYCKGNIIKYILRASKKNGIEDLKKARKYIDYILESEE